MTTEIEEAIKQRDEAKQNRHNDEPRYKEADEVKDQITEKQKEIWKRKVLDSQEAGNVWQMVRNLKDGPRECKNKVIIHNNKTRVTDRQKTRAFMSHYKKTSNITLKEEDRWAKKAVNEHLRKPTCDLATAEARIQEALNVVAQWSTKWKLTISGGKCEASFFSTNSHESKWRPKLTIGEEEIPYSENPKFLGVTYDKQLTFTDPANNVAKSKSRALVHLAGTDWGYDKATLRSTYLAIGRTIMDYAGAAWQPWLSKTSFEKLESAQRFAGRIITGHLKTTPNECILLDINLTSMVTKCRQNAVIALEKSKRLPPNNPRRQVIKKGEATNYETELEKWGDQGMGRDLQEQRPHKPFPAREESVDRYDQDQFQIQRDEEVRQ